MPEFRVVTDDYRGDRFSELTRTLMDGKTVLVPPGTHLGGVFQTLKRNGFRMRQHKRADGISVWADRHDGVKNDG